MELKDSNPKDAIGVKKWRQFFTVPLQVLWEVGVAMLEGALKYGRHNYRASGVRASVYVDAAIGHILSWTEGQDLDPDTRLSHITKAIASLFVLRDAEMNGFLVDDRPPRVDVEGHAARLQEIVDEMFEKHADKNPEHMSQKVNGAPYLGGSGSRELDALERAFGTRDSDVERHNIFKDAFEDEATVAQMRAVFDTNDKGFSLLGFWPEGTRYTGDADKVSVLSTNGITHFLDANPDFQVYSVEIRADYSDWSLVRKQSRESFPADLVEERRRALHEAEKELAILELEQDEDFDVPIVRGWDATEADFDDQKILAEAADGVSKLAQAVEKARGYERSAAGADCLCIDAPRPCRPCRQT